MKLIHNLLTSFSSKWALITIIKTKELYDKLKKKKIKDISKSHVTKNIVIEKLISRVI